MSGSYDEGHERLLLQAFLLYLRKNHALVDRTTGEPVWRDFEHNALINDFMAVKAEIDRRAKEKQA